MSTSVADIYEDYLESLQNLPSEIDQNMHELRRMDDDLQKFRETYTKHKRSYVKQYKSSPNSNSMNLAATRLQLEKDYKTAMQKQDQKIELAMRMYDLVSRHIERLDSQVTKSGLSESDWISPRSNRKGPTGNYNDGGQRKRTLGSIDSGARKRIHHSSRPIPSNGNSAAGDPDIDINEPTYCYCKQVSFGDMIACDSENCEREWFHYNCVGLVEPPAGKWFCEECRAEEEYNNQTGEEDEEDEENEDDSTP
ncbi:hypothetical protein [Parasitella parasitica]|uniref:Chromatin modification-related protein n=1 Tax=Parasitella parasitica TaxID=35722 RepID=A0A0B7NFW5_9FUNG|nr:hypothetical protein [Parasitella parasitica]